MMPKCRRRTLLRTSAKQTDERLRMTRLLVARRGCAHVIAQRWARVEQKGYHAGDGAKDFVDFANLFYVL